MMTITVTCGWCHAPNRLTWAATYCRDCGHRADVSRSECTCNSCAPLQHRDYSDRDIQDEESTR